MASKPETRIVWGVCEVEINVDRVEDTPVNYVYMVVAMSAYAALAGHLFYNFYEFAQKKGARKALSSNKYQVIVSLAMGSIWRIPSFVETNCVLEEMFRLLKDVFIMLSFLLIVMFWVEMQSSMSKVSSVDRLRPYVIAVMVAYTISRTFQGVADLYLTRSLWLISAFITALIYAGVLATGVYFGCALMRKMGSMTLNDALKAKLQRMTSFIVYEIGILFLIFLAWLTRTQAFGDAKDNDKWLWWGLKLIEKVLEFISIAFLVQIVAPVPYHKAFPCIPCCQEGEEPATDKKSGGGGAAAAKTGGPKTDVEAGGGGSRSGGSSRGGGSRGGGARGGGGRGGPTSGGSRGGGGRGGAKDSKTTPSVEMTAKKSGRGSGGSKDEDPATSNPLNVADHTQDDESEVSTNADGSSTSVDNPMHA